MMWQQARHGYHPIGANPPRISTVVLWIILLMLLIAICVH
jgi:hypothetical protein